MVYLYTILKDHFRKEFDWLSVVLVFLFAGILVLLQYQFHLIRPNILALPHLQRLPVYWLLFSAVFIVSCAILYFRKQIPNVFVQKEFWLLTALAFLINGFDQSYLLLSFVKEHSFENEAVKAATVSIATHSVSILSVIVPVALCSIYFKPRPSFYGLTLNNETKVKPYFSVLAIVLALVSISSFSAGISDFYPILNRSGLYIHAEELGIPKPLAVAIFETVYASDFVAVELFFRGFLIFGFAKLLGKQVILPMAACYMIFHFGKPLVETLSSFFGGYILGVFAWNTRNIWGGVILHIGTALFMEFVGYFV
jgi:hypothetical protein